MTILQKTAHLIYQISVSVAILTLALLASYAYGSWSNPPASPPGSNVEAPINTSTTYQYKAGNIGADEFIAATNVRSDQFCNFDGSECVTFEQIRDAI